MYNTEMSFYIKKKTSYLKKYLFMNFIDKKKFKIFRALSFLLLNNSNFSWLNYIIFTIFLDTLFEVHYIINGVILT